MKTFVEECIVLHCIYIHYNWTWRCSIDHIRLTICLPLQV